MTASPSMHYSRHHKATEEEGDPGVHGKGIWRKKCACWVSGTAAERWRSQHKTELDGDKWFVACAPPGAATTHKSSK